LKKLARKGKRLLAVAMDMGIAYFSAVREALPNVDIVFDRYHIRALMNQGIDTLRRDQQKELDRMGKETLKGNRFLLLRNYDSLNSDHKARLDNLMQANQPLFVMHSMKEQLRLFWEKTDYNSAMKFLDTWCKDAMQSGIKQLVKVAKTLSGYRTALLNYFKHRITNAVLEGVNNKIKTLKRQAYGFRDMEYFKLRLYHLHTQRYSFSGRTFFYANSLEPLYSCLPVPRKIAYFFRCRSKAFSAFFAADSAFLAAASAFSAAASPLFP